MIKFFFITLILFPIFAHSREPICHEIISVFKDAATNHYKEIKFDDEFIKKTLKEYLNSYKVIPVLNQREVDNFIEKTKIEERAKFINGDCSFYEDIEEFLDLKKIELKKNILSKLNHKRDIKIKKIKQRPSSEEEINENIYLWIKSVNNYKQKDVSLKKRVEFLLRINNRIDKTKIPSKVINSMVSSLDPYSSFMTSSEKDIEFSDISGASSGGLGVMILKIEQGMKIESIIKDSPAEKSGLKKNDVIIEIDNVKISKLKSESIYEKIKGFPGTKMKLKILRGKKRIVKNVVREKINFIRDSNFSTEIHKDYLIAKVNSFYYENFKGKEISASKDLERFLIKNKKQKLVVLDLRGNPGGLVSEAQKMVSLFQKDPTPVATKSKYLLQKFPVKSNYLDNRFLIVVVNNLSASASEIVAGALKDYKRAIIIGGKKTYGKGSVQVIYPINNGYTELGTLKITNSLYFSPSGRTPQYKGVSSDILINKKDLPGEEGNRNTIKSIKIKSFQKVGRNNLKRIIRKIKRKYKYKESEEENIKNIINISLDIIK